MNTGLKKAYAGLFASGMLALAAVTGLTGMTSPAAFTSSPASAASVASALSEVWSNPVNISRSGLYDNTPDIGASALNGAVTIAWEQRDVAGGDNFLKENSNAALGAAFPSAVTLDNAGYKLNGNARVKEDSTGTRHVVFWQQNGSIACDYYARIAPDGTVAQEGQIPGACYGQKNVAIAVGTDGTVHALFGKDLDNVGYYRRDPSGVWSIVNEAVPGGRDPKNIAIGVSSRGVVMAAYVDRGPAHNDVFTTTRNPDGTWTEPEDISAGVLPYSWANPHLPNIDRDSNGGLRIAWSQATRADENTTYDDVFYREWVPGTGWNNQNIYQLTANSGNSYNADISVDWSGKAHIVWQDDTGRSQSNFQIFYASGRAADFNVVGRLFPQFGQAYTKEASLAVNPPITGHSTGNIHVTFGSVQQDPQKENYYSYADLADIIPPPPSVTPTPCTPGFFSDVHPTDYYYQAVHDLSIAGVISGYADCTFRPVNNITRGQAAKIIILAANITTNTQGGPHFTDVPTNNPFYSYIETAYNAGIIAGYNDHTFRPNANVTRGQFSKMIVNAFHLRLNTQGGPHFTDVLTTNPFYREVETAYNAGLISGYADHTFKPFNNITRGQAAKIVALARTHLPTVTPTSTHTPIPTTTPTSVSTATPSAGTETVTTTPVVVTATPTDTPVVVTATPTDTPVVVTETPTDTPVVVTATPTDTETPTSTTTPVR